MSHTKEPWISVIGGRHDPEVIITTQHRLDNSMGEICGMDVEFTGKHGKEQKANAHRIVACVNACAGIPTDDLERWGVSLIDKLREDEANNIARHSDQLAAEMQEQARIIGMSGEREARLLARVEELKRENEALRKDAERYRWLKDNPSVEYGVRYEEEGPVFDVFRVTGSVNDREWENIGTGPTLAAAIDAAMKGQ